MALPRKITGDAAEQVNGIIFVAWPNTPILKKWGVTKLSAVVVGSNPKMIDTQDLKGIFGDENTIFYLEACKEFRKQVSEAKLEKICNIIGHPVDEARFFLKPESNISPWIENAMLNQVEVGEFTYEEKPIFKFLEKFVDTISKEASHESTFPCGAKAS